MSTSEFMRSCKQLRKKYNFESGPEFLDKLKELFLGALGQGEDMSLELFDYCIGSDGFEDGHAEKLGDMVDLFAMDYDMNYNQLGEEDWDYLKDLVNAYALDMDMNVVTYVMQHVVEAGVFD